LKTVQPRDDVALSIGRYESYVRADPGNALLWVNLGELYHKAARYDEAAACFERCVQDHPEFAGARSGLASVMLSRNQFPEAERLLRELVAGTAEDPALLFNLGLSLYYQKRGTEAEHCFNRALSCGLTTPDCYAYLARCRHLAGDVSRAIECCRQWVDVAGDTESRGYLALLHLDQGNVADAKALAQDVLQTSPDNVHAGLVLGTASIESQQIEAAHTLFEGILLREPDNARAWLGVGLAQLYLQKAPEAVAALEKAGQLIPDSVGIRVTLGWAQLAARDVLRAERVFRDAVDIDRNFAEAHGGLATALALQTRVDEARESIRRARGLDANSFGAIFAQTIILKLQGRERTATEILANLLLQAPRPDGKTLIEQIEIFTRRHPPAGPTDGRTHRRPRP
jgi:tetratricopeptide (TPR) repeat protein